MRIGENAVGIAGESGADCGDGEPDWIIAMGGGSPIDAAKAMWIKYEYPECTFEDMRKVFGLPNLRRKAHFCAISSASGTATEVTAFSIITDYSKGTKYPIADFEITPDVAIVDPDLAETMPKKLVAHTGMDAMTHAIEAYVSTANCDFTDPLAIHAIEMIMKDLVPSYNGDMAARDSMHNAQHLAGVAFSNARWVLFTPWRIKPARRSQTMVRTSSAARTTVRRALRRSMYSSSVCRKSLKTPSATPARAPTRVSPARRKWRSCSRAAAMIPRRISKDSPRKMTVRGCRTRRSLNLFGWKRLRFAGQREFLSN